MKFITFLKQTISSLAIVLFVGCNQKSEQAEIEAPIITDEVLLQLKDSADIPAISIAIFKDGNTLYNNSLGVKNWDDKDSIDANTIFEAASLTKCVAAYCALKLVEEGILDLDKPLSDYYKLSSFSAILSKAF